LVDMNMKTWQMSSKEGESKLDVRSPGFAYFKGGYRDNNRNSCDQLTC